MFELKLVLFTVVFTFENLRFLKMAETNIEERAKKLKVYLYLQWRKRSYANDINAYYINDSLKKASKKRMHKIS